MHIQPCLEVVTEGNNCAFVSSHSPTQPPRPRLPHRLSLPSRLGRGPRREILCGGGDADEPLFRFFYAVVVCVRVFGVGFFDVRLSVVGLVLGWERNRTPELKWVNERVHVGERRIRCTPAPPPPMPRAAAAVPVPVPLCVASPSDCTFPSLYSARIYTYIHTSSPAPFIARSSPTDHGFPTYSYVRLPSPTHAYAYTYE
ncbi:hypothetical protein C8R45DRAFT_1214254 [Mycena sanguinolenta]|nr:hypothetical protein C8R45DRAFT_1214254 [Mycena sanguinolenta]